MMTQEQWLEDENNTKAIKFENRIYNLKEMHEKIDWFEDKIDSLEICDDDDGVRNTSRKLRVHLKLMQDIISHGYKLYKDDFK